MKRNSATQLLCLLSTEEIRKFNKFLRSPYFNYSPPVLTLFEQLRKWHPDYEPKKIRPTIFWKNIFPDKPFSEQKYWWLNFKLRCLIEEFMAVEQLRSNEFEFKQQLVQSHKKRNEHSLLEKEVKLLADQLQKQDYQDISSYAKAFWIKHDYFFNPLTDKYGGAIFSVEDAMEELDRFYVLAKLRLASEIKNRERIFSKKANLRLLEESREVSNIFEKENPVFSMYRNVLDLYDPEKDVAAFKTGKKSLDKLFTKLSRHDQSEILLNLRNFAIRQLNKGDTAYWKELLDLYKTGINLNLLIDNDKISAGAFGNIVQTGCEENEFEWVEEFIKNYNKYIDEEIREEAEAMSYGVLYFQKKEFHEAIDLLTKQPFKQILYQINARVVILKSWFEIYLFDFSIFEFITSKIEADEKFYRRNNTISDQKKLAHINFILAVKYLVELTYQRRKKQDIVEKMNKYLNENKSIISKKWLIEKSSQIK